eukprot:gi/632989359/ref/XP_007883609.1/ PREDICTED: uncharacterized protein LOC103172687 [Callorhinchus milii]
MLQSTTVRGTSPVRTRLPRCPVCPERRFETCREPRSGASPVEREDGDRFGLNQQFYPGRHSGTDCADGRLFSLSPQTALLDARGGARAEALPGPRISTARGGEREAAPGGGGGKRTGATFAGRPQSGTEEGLRDRRESFRVALWPICTDVDISDCVAFLGSVDSPSHPSPEGEKLREQEIGLETICRPQSEMEGLRVPGYKDGHIKGKKKYCPLRARNRGNGMERKSTNFNSKCNLI